MRPLQAKAASSSTPGKRAEWPYMAQRSSDKRIIELFLVSATDVPENVFRSDMEVLASFLPPDLLRSVTAPGRPILRCSLLKRIFCILRSISIAGVYRSISSSGHHQLSPTLDVRLVIALPRTTILVVPSMEFLA
jgi:hypothetical protein